MSRDMQCKPEHWRQRIPPKWMQKILVHRKQRHSYLARSPCCSHMMSVYYVQYARKRNASECLERSRDTGWWLWERDVRISTYEYYFCIGLIQMYCAVMSILSIWRYSKVYHQSKKKSKCRQWQIFSIAEFKIHLCLSKVYPNVMSLFMSDQASVF